MKFADWWTLAQADSEERLRLLGGLGDDDSLRARTVADALDGFAALLDGREPVGNSDGLAAIARILAEQAHRVAERQMLDDARRAAKAHRQAA